MNFKVMIIVLLSIFAMVIAKGGRPVPGTPQYRPQPNPRPVFKALRRIVG